MISEDDFIRLKGLEHVCSAINSLGQLSENNKIPSRDLAEVLSTLYLWRDLLKKD